MAKILWVLLALAGAAPAVAAERTLLVLGDSLSAGYGVADGSGWVSLLQDRLLDRTPTYRVVNASISGDTTASALARLPTALLHHKPDIVIVELGGNDGLRGLSLEAMNANLAAIIERVQAAGARVLLVAVRLPPNYGPVYLQRFRSVYHELADRYRVPLVPEVLAGVADDPALMQEDGIHPRAGAQALILDNVWPQLLTLLAEAGRSR